MSNECEPEDREEDHVTDLPDGAGCTEIWEHLSERRNGSKAGTSRENQE